VSRGHARYEALAGALALGEASETESVEYAAHALICPECAADRASFPALATRLAESRDAEQWRPSVSDALARRMQERRERGMRRALGAFGYVIALSAALNFVFVGGFAGRAFDAVRAARESVAAPAPPAAASNPRAVAHPKPLHRAVGSPIGLAFGPPARCGAGTQGARPGETNVGCRASDAHVEVSAEAPPR